MTDPAIQQIPAGQAIGPYQIVRRLGAGGMGEVYLARHRHLNRDAAVKVLLPEISMQQAVVGRFFTEARATAQLRHPNIVEIFDCDVLPDGRAYIVMEYLRGESLRATLDRVGPLGPDWNSIAAISGMVAAALEAAHDSGIVHRDLKPDNMYLAVGASQREGLNVKVLDFGIAKLLSGGDRTGGSGTPTRTGSLIGTPLYMSPEQCRGIATIDHRADIYSLGCVMFEMVVGQPPFVAEAPGDILMAHILQNAPALSTFQTGIPPQLDTLVARMLAKDPAMRPQSMAEVVALVEALLGTRKSDFAACLRAPAGFPEAVGHAATQILPTTDIPLQPAPPLGKRAGIPGGVAPTTPLGLDGTRAKSAPGAHATPGRLPAPSSGGPSRSARPMSTSTPVSAETSAEAPADLSLDQAPSLSPTRPAWLVPAAILVAVVGAGGMGAYLITKPKPTASTTEAEPSKKAETTEPGGPAGTFAPPSEVSIDIASSPEGAEVWIGNEESPRGNTPLSVTLPRTTTPVDVTLKAAGHYDKRLALDASRNNHMRVNLEVRASEPEQASGAHAPVKIVEKPATSSASKKKNSGKSGSLFKAVGD